MAATITLEKITGELMGWTVLDDNASGAPFLNTSQLDISSQVSCLLHLDMAACTTAAIGIAGEAVVFGKSGSTNGHWHEVCRRSYGTTANGKVDISNGINSGEISCSMGDTTGIETIGQNVLIYDTGTPANSMMNMLADYSNDVDLFFCFSAINDYTNSADILCPTGSTEHGVKQWDIRIPEEYWGAKVTFFNNDGDVNYLCRVRYSMVED